jgi:hypothetical protein
MPVGGGAPARNDMQYWLCTCILLLISCDRTGEQGLARHRSVADRCACERPAYMHDDFVGFLKASTI